jgi:hypothetical protein
MPLSRKQALHAPAWPFLRKQGGKTRSENSVFPVKTGRTGSFRESGHINGSLPSQRLPRTPYGGHGPGSRPKGRFGLRENYTNMAELKENIDQGRPLAGATLEQQVKLIRILEISAHLLPEKKLYYLRWFIIYNKY